MWSWAPRALAGLGAVAVGGVLVWGAAGTGVPRAASLDEGAVVLADDARTAPSPEPRPSVPPAPPVPRTTVLCSDLKPRSIPTKDLDTDEPGALVLVGDRTCVVTRPEGVAVP